MTAVDPTAVAPPRARSSWRPADHPEWTEPGHDGVWPTDPPAGSRASSKDVDPEGEAPTTEAAPEAPTIRTTRTAASSSRSRWRRTSSRFGDGEERDRRRGERTVSVHEADATHDRRAPGADHRSATPRLPRERRRQERRSRPCEHERDDRLAGRRLDGDPGSHVDGRKRLLEQGPRRCPGWGDDQRRLRELGCAQRRRAGTTAAGADASPSSAPGSSTNISS